MEWYVLSAEIPSRFNTRYAWCYKVKDSVVIFRNNPTGGLVGVEYPDEIEANFEGGKAWPDVSSNGSSFKKLLFSEQAIKVLHVYDKTLSKIGPIKVTIEDSKTLKKVPSPNYYVVDFSIKYKLSDLRKEQSFELFELTDYFSVICNDTVREALISNNITNIKFKPLMEYVEQIDEMRQRLKK